MGNYGAIKYGKTHFLRNSQGARRFMWVFSFNRAFHVLTWLGRQTPIIQLFTAKKLSKEPQLARRKHKEKWKMKKDGSYFFHTRSQLLINWTSNLTEWIFILVNKYTEFRKTSKSGWHVNIWAIQSTFVKHCKSCMVRWTLGTIFLNVVYLMITSNMYSLGEPTTW